MRRVDGNRAMRRSTWRSAARLAGAKPSIGASRSGRTAPGIRRSEVPTAAAASTAHKPAGIRRIARDATPAPRHLESEADTPHARVRVGYAACASRSRIRSVSDSDSGDEATQGGNCCTELVVADVGSRPQTQDVAACVGKNRLLAQGMRQIDRARRPDGKEAGAPLRRHLLDVRDGRIAAEAPELAAQQPTLTHADRSKPLGRKNLRDMKVEHRGGPVV